MIDADSDETEPIELARQAGEFILWQIKSKKQTKETQIIEQLVWVDGFKRHQILTPIYEDVLPKIKNWREQYNCSIFVASSVGEEILKVFLENTEKGNVAQYLSGYLSSQRPGDKLITETYGSFYQRIKNSTNLPSQQVHVSPSDRSASRPSVLNGESRSNSGHQSPRKPQSPTLSRLSSISSTASDSTVKPVLFLTDSGQEAKAASLAIDGSAFECILVNRPGNRRIRSYYLSRFQYVDTFEDVEFV